MRVAGPALQLEGQAMQGAGDSIAPHEMAPVELHTLTFTIH